MYLISSFHLSGVLQPFFSTFFYLQNGWPVFILSWISRIFHVHQKPMECNVQATSWAQRRGVSHLSQAIPSQFAPGTKRQKVCLRTIRFQGVSCWFWGVYEKAMNCSIFVFHALWVFWVMVFSCVIPFSFKDYVQIFAWFSGFGFFERVKCITQVCMCSSETKFLTETNNAVGDVTSAVLESRLKTWSCILQNSLMQTLPCFLASSPSQMLTLKIIYSNPPHFLHLSLWHVSPSGN